MKQSSLVPSIISSRLAVVGTAEFQRLNLSPEEIRIYLTVKERADWPERMQKVIPDLGDLEVDEEEL
ncbi:hypothetical protein Q9L42_000215 (plasmid) [Methylomarinum sp. Ch1-1]|uniref:Uncharacterized protein n=1 Tax=Methylomarinum roseum TaxID=3067653 RepID=A0AAU7NP74_9GAMM|nr:hypothetical protein [Methylomarinum sp. Ch1-1]MDP4523135.1 hypothetical protein [Methylomarinum sp. Ch1-1]